MTETSPVIAVRLEENIIIGTVGPTLQDTEVRITDIETGEIIYPNPALPHQGRGVKGEIRIKGPQVMKGYYRDPEQTKLTIQNGWLRTGDLGMITFNDCLKILGRSKSTVVLLSGENLEPEPIEMRLTQSPFIEHCMVVGQDQKYIGALIVPNIEGFRDDGFKVDSLQELAKDSEAKSIIHDEIKRMISVENGYKRFELIHDFRLIGECFSNGEELTGLLKMKRHVVTDKYEKLIDEMYHHETSEEL
jgi:long-chain acyl-CoA synthetase